jgi:hypothetical protein
MPLNIVGLAPDALFYIDITPRMPSIRCEARITGSEPDPTEGTLFNWSIKITDVVPASGCASSRLGSCTQVLNGQNVGGVWTPVFKDIQGGEAMISVRATIHDEVLQASVNVKIRGANPPVADITARLGGAGKAGPRIAFHESGNRQFDETGMPLLGPGGDVGVMQLCNPAATCRQRWSWIANVDAGLALVTEKENAAQHYLNQHRVQGHYPNDQGLSDAEVLLRETIQRYNGGRYWTWDQTHNLWKMAPQNQYVASVLGFQ